MKVGILTIGQSPRVDVIPEIRDVLGPDVEIVEKGAQTSIWWFWTALVSANGRNQYSEK